MEMVLFFRKHNRDLPGKIAYAIFSGVGGTLLLVAFFAALLDAYQVFKYLPWMIAFNTAMTGFSIVEKTRDRMVRPHLTAVGAGMANVIITCVILMILTIYLFGENLISISTFLLFAVIGAVCSALGAWLAVTYFK